MANIVPLVETRQIVEDLFMGYIRNIKIHGIEQWDLEYFKDSKNQAICFKRMNDVPILEQNIAGGYTAELSFTVSHQASMKSIRNGIDITSPLNDLAATFDKETRESFPNLKLSEAEPISLEMTSTPVDDSGENSKMATFIAAYKLVYQKKGVYEL